MFAYCIICQMTFVFHNHYQKNSASECLYVFIAGADISQLHCVGRFSCKTCWVRSYGDCLGWGSTCHLKVNLPSSISCQVSCLMFPILHACFCLWLILHMRIILAFGLPCWWTWRFISKFEQSQECCKNFCHLPYMGVEIVSTVNATYWMFTVLIL